MANSPETLEFWSEELVKRGLPAFKTAGDGAKRLARATPPTDENGKG